MRYNVERHIMLVIISIFIQLIIGQAAEWLVELVTHALDKCYAFPSGLISSEGTLGRGLGGRQFQVFLPSLAG